MKELTEADNCFVCGKNNSAGLKIDFQIENDICLGRFKPSSIHVGFGETVHGGIIYSVLDDAMANWFYLQGGFGYTAKAEIRYRSHMVIGETGLISCELSKMKGKLLLLESKIRSETNNRLIAECEGKFLLSSLGSIGKAD